MSEEVFYTVQESERLDVFLSKKLQETRSQIAQLIKKEAVKVDGKKIAKPGVKLKADQSVHVQLPKVEQKESYAVDFDVEVLYEDDTLLVLNKPSGLVVHAAPSVFEATLVDWLKQRGVSLSTISGEERHGIVHRLDKGTSGVMVVAKTNHAHQELSKQLENKTMGRYYLAVIKPPLKEMLSVVEKPIARSANNRIKMGIVPSGKEAKTAFGLIANSNDEKEQLIACKLFSGRTHQIRVHLESIGRHIVGDNLYGGGSKKDATEQILLHAYVLYLVHPVTKQKMQWVAKYDKNYQDYLEKKFTRKEIDEKILPQSITSLFSAFGS